MICLMFVSFSCVGQLMSFSKGFQMHDHYWNQTVMCYTYALLRKIRPYMLSVTFIIQHWPKKIQRGIKHPHQLLNVPSLELELLKVKCLSHFVIINRASVFPLWQISWITLAGDIFCLLWPGDKCISYIPLTEMRHVSVILTGFSHCWHSPVSCWPLAMKFN